MPRGSSSGIEIYGLEKLSGKLREIDENILPELERATDRALLLVHSRVPPYPPPRPRQRYRRTGTLGRSITTKVVRMGRKITGAIGTRYGPAPWVIGHEKLEDGRGPQAWMHKGRWWILEDVVEDSRRDVIRIYREAVRHIRRNFR